MKSIVLLFAIVALTGCAIQPPATSAETIEAQVPLICESGSECAMYWRRAQAWLATHGAMKIQVATDTVLETYNPLNSNPVYGFKFIRVPGAGQSERISIYMVCGNPFGCLEPKERVAIRLKRYIRTGAE